MSVIVRIRWQETTLKAMPLIDVKEKKIKVAENLIDLIEEESGGGFEQGYVERWSSSHPFGHASHTLVGGMPVLLGPTPGIYMESIKLIVRIPKISHLCQQQNYQCEYYNQTKFITQNLYDLIKHPPLNKGKAKIRQYTYKIIPSNRKNSLNLALFQRLI